MSAKRHIGFIGFGNMGCAIGYSLCQAENSLFVSDPNIDQEAIQPEFSPAITLCHLTDVFNHCDLIFLCIKPQYLDAISIQIKALIKDNHIVISMLAGISLQRLSDQLNTNQVVRIMPNTPAILGKGVTGICFNDAITDDSKNVVIELCNVFGQTFQLPNEDHMNVITAVSGSGPAFFYRIIDVFSKFAESKGLPSDVALSVALNTMLGAGSMLQKKPNPDLLIKQVTSPNGTTQAGLNTMDELKFNDKLQDVLHSAWQRSIELSRGEK